MNLFINNVQASVIEMRYCDPLCARNLCGFHMNWEFKRTFKHFILFRTAEISSRFKSENEKQKPLIFNYFDCPVQKNFRFYVELSSFPLLSAPMFINY